MNICGIDKYGSFQYFVYEASITENREQTIPKITIAQKNIIWQFHQEHRLCPLIFNVTYQFRNIKA